MNSKVILSKAQKIGIPINTLDTTEKQLEDVKQFLNVDEEYLEKRVDDLYNQKFPNNQNNVVSNVPSFIPSTKTNIPDNDEFEASRKAGKVGLKAAANYVAPGIGGTVVDLADKTKLGQKTLDNVGEQINKLPNMGRNLKALNQAGVLDQADKMTNLVGSKKISTNNIHANRQNPGQNLQGVIKKENSEEKPEEKLNEEIENANLNEENPNLNGQNETQEDSKTEPTKKRGKGKKNDLKSILKDPDKLAILLPILAFLLIFFLILMIVFVIGGVVGADASSGSSSDSSSGNSEGVITSGTSTESCRQLSSEPLGTFLQSKGSSIEEFNNQIVANVNAAGFGTRAGVVAAANAITSDLCQNYGVRLPYEWGGGHGSISLGAKDSWGGDLASPIYDNGRSYLYSGLDCSGYVSWAIYNGGFNFTAQDSEGFLNYGEAHSMKSSDFVGQPGDLVHHSGHIMIIVGVDESAKEYQVAEAAGGDEGMRVRSLAFDGGSSNNSIIDMSNFYGNASNRRSS